MVTILMMPGLLKVKVFQNKSYDVVMSIHDVTSKVLSLDTCRCGHVTKVW